MIPALKYTTLIKLQKTIVYYVKSLPEISWTAFIDRVQFNFHGYRILANKDKMSWLTWYFMNLGIVGALEALCKFEEPLSSSRRAMAALAAARRRVAAQRRRQASWASEHRNDRGTSKCCMWAWRPEKFSSEPKVLIYRSISIRGNPQLNVCFLPI